MINKLEFIDAHMVTATKADKSIKNNKAKK